MCKPSVFDVYRTADTPGILNGMPVAALDPPPSIALVASKDLVEAGYARREALRPEAGQVSTAFIAWKDFVETGRLHGDAVRPQTAQAWLRCREAGVDPFVGRNRNVLTEGELRKLLEKRNGLIDIARPFMRSLYQFMASSSFVVLLCDERGYILETTGDPEVIKNGPDLNFDRGARWTEQEIGNNGVGTTLFLKRPFQVSGAEHFCRKHHPWTCSGAPIVDDEGEMIGILEMSGPVGATHQHTLGMVVAAAEAIRQQLRVQAKNHQLTLLNARLNNLFLTVSDGVVVVDARGVIEQVNPVAEKIFKAKASALVGTSLAQYLARPSPVRELLASGRAFSDLEMNVHAQAELSSCLASGKPIQDEQGRVTSGVVFLNPLRRLNKLVNRISGALATFTFDDIIGRGHALTKAIQVGLHSASGDSTVLLRGESGTGKEMFAHAIHNRSARRPGPFIAVSCGAIPRELIGSELFGYDEGAFTGARRHGRPGKFELAAGGTLFLDEIGDMPLDQQVSLLRVLQDKTITRIGGDKALVIDVRIICATNKDLPREIAKGNFRQDLYYRLNVVSITLPPLREHREDIPLMFKVFHERICGKLGVEVAPVDPEVIARLQEYDWPGNIREFQNAVEKIVSMPTEHGIGVGDLPDEISVPAELHPDGPRSLMAAIPTLREQRARIKQALAEEEQRHIMEQLTRHSGNVSRTARALGISRTAIYKKLGRRVET